MAYQVPSRFSHGDFPLAAQMNKYSDSIEYLYGLANTRQPAILSLGGQHANMFHVYRWLWYRTSSGSGEVEDPSGVGEDYTLPESDDEFTAFDLDKVDWLTPGRRYTVTGCEFCMEDNLLEDVSIGTSGATSSFTQNSNQDTAQTFDATETEQRNWMGL